MSKLSIQEEKELVSFIKDWLKTHGFTQKDLANELNIKSSRTSEIILKMKELYKKGGMFNIAKNLIKIEQKWLNNIKNDYLETKQTAPYKHLFIELNNFDSAYSFLNESDEDITYAMKLGHKFYLNDNDFYQDEVVLKCDAKDNLEAEALEDFTYWGEL